MWSSVHTWSSYLLLHKTPSNRIDPSRYQLLSLCGWYIQGCRASEWTWFSRRCHSDSEPTPEVEFAQGSQDEVSGPTSTAHSCRSTCSSCLIWTPQLTSKRCSSSSCNSSRRDSWQCRKSSCWSKWTHIYQGYHLSLPDTNSVVIGYCLLYQRECLSITLCIPEIATTEHTLGYDLGDEDPQEQTSVKLHLIIVYRSRSLFKAASLSFQPEILYRFGLLSFELRKGEPTWHFELPMSTCILLFQKGVGFLGVSCF